MHWLLRVRAFERSASECLLILHLLEDPNHEFVGVVLHNRIEFLPNQLLKFRIKYVSLAGGLIVNACVEHLKLLAKVDTLAS